MKILFPNKNLLQKTGIIDYYHWNYKFPLRFIQRYRFKQVVRLLGNIKYNRLLEVGMGSGIFLPELAKHCDTLYACDIHNNFNHIHKLCEYHKIENYNISNQDIKSTDFEDNYFDVIIAVSVLEYIHDLQDALGEIKRILKRDGILITITPMENKFLEWIISLYTDKATKSYFRNSYDFVTGSLEESYLVLEKGYFVPILGKFFPVYTHYKLKNVKI